MSSKEKVLAIRPEAVCMHHQSNPMVLFAILDEGKEIGWWFRTEPEAWTAAYKYLTK